MSSTASISTDDHRGTASHSMAEHAHSDLCGHEQVGDGRTAIYLHDGRRHTEHGDHYDED